MPNFLNVFSQQIFTLIWGNIYINTKQLPAIETTMTHIAMRKELGIIRHRENGKTILSNVKVRLKNSKSMENFRIVIITAYKYRVIANCVTL